MTEPVAEPTKSSGLHWLRTGVGMVVLYWLLGSCSYTSSWAPKFFRKTPPPQSVPFDVRMLQEGANRAEYEGRQDEATRLRNEAAAKEAERRKYEDWKRQNKK